MPNILSIGISTPGDPVSQKSISSFMALAHGMSDSSDKTRLEALYRASGIDTRYSVLDDYSKSSDFVFFPNNKEMEPFPSVRDRMNLYDQHASDLAIAAVENCLLNASTDPSEITHVITASCTGMQAPGLDIQLIKKLQLNSGVHRTAVNYMGCYAALSALKLANDACRANENAKVLVVCLELCSIHFQKDPSEDNMLANSLFGDGAAAVVVGNSTSDRYISMDHFKSEIFPDGEDDMAWSIGNTGFEMRLSTYVPDIIRVGIKDLVEELKRESGTEEIDQFAIHPGGKKILDVVKDKLELEKDDLTASYQILREYGNMSSPTILFVMHRILHSVHEETDQKMLSLAFGPGLTVESAIMTLHNA